MKTSVFLADAAQTDTSGKVHALGLGWSVTTSPTPPAAIVAIVEVDWTEANTRHKIEFDLIGADGEPVLIPNPNVPGELEPLHIETEFEQGRPPGLPHGSSFFIPFTITIGAGIPLTPGARYEWRVRNSGHPDEDALASFFVRPQS